MKKVLALLLLSSSLMISGFVFAADQAPQPGAPSAPQQMTHEQRVKMANAHEKMAACLRSDRPLADCRSEMMKTCHGLMGKAGCPMMGGMGGGMMRQGGRHMGPPSDAGASNKP